MTKRSDQNESGKRPLDVDGVIHHAREASWRLPDEAPETGPAAGGGASHAAPDHAPAEHGSGHGGGHSDEPALGPVDTQMWGAGIVSTAVGLIVVAGFVLATSGSGAY